MKARKEQSCPAHQTQPSPLFPQQVLGVAILMIEVGIVYGGVVCGLKLKLYGSVCESV
jgi:hypothetical protein